VLGFIVRRLAASTLVVILTSMFVFLLFFKGPSNPAEPLCNLNGKCTPTKLALLTEQLGLNDSVVHQYGLFAKGMFQDREISFGAKYHCDAPCFGISYRTKGEVSKELIHKFPATLSIALVGSIIYLTFGVFLGTMAARYRGTALDRSLVAFSVFVSSIPYYIVALLAWIVFSLQLKLFTDTSYHPITHGIGAWAWGLTLPWLCIGIASSTSYARFSRGQMIETLGEDYIRTATAKGLKPSTVMYKHGLRAAIVPIITIFGLDFAALLAGTIFTERIFDIDGIGRWAIDAIRSPIDFPVVQATVMFSSVIIVLANLIVDVLYSVIDPRVRLT
jgi:peptide/nickel transport system permease protein